MPLAKPTRIIRPKLSNGIVRKTVPLVDGLPSGGIQAKLWEPEMHSTQPRESGTTGPAHNMIGPSHVC